MFGVTCYSTTSILISELTRQLVFARGKFGSDATIDQYGVRSNNTYVVLIKKLKCPSIDVFN